MFKNFFCFESGLRCCFESGLRCSLESGLRCCLESGLRCVSPSIIILENLLKKDFYVRLIKNIKTDFFLIGFWGGFGPILDPDSNSARKTVYITWFRSIFHRFLKIRLF